MATQIRLSGGKLQRQAQARRARIAHHDTVPGVDAAALERALHERVRGDVRFDAPYRAAYSCDSSNYRQAPLGVVCPRDADDVAAAVEACRRFDAPITARGAGTSLAGQATNAAVVLDTSRHMRSVLGVDPSARLARVQPGVIRDQLAKPLEAEHGLSFPPDTSTHAYATFGGMIANNSCGAHSVMTGRTSDNLEALEVLLYDGTRLSVGPTSNAELERIVAAGARRGEIYAALRDLRDRYDDFIRERYPRIPRRVSGFNLDELLPENGFHVARAGRQRGHMRADARGDRSAASVAPGAHAADPRLPVDLRGCRPRPGDHGAGADGVRGDRPGAGRRHARAGPAPERDPDAARRARLAARGVRRRDARGERREGPRRPRAPGTRRGVALHAHVRRRGRRGADLEGARGRARRDRLPPGRAGPLRGLGGLGPATGALRRLPARLPEAAGPLQLRHLTVWSLRPGARTHAHQLPPAQPRRRQGVARVPRRRRRSRRAPRRLAVQRARRRAVARGAPAEDVRPRARARVRRVQAHLGPRRPPESGQGRRSLRADREPQARPRLRAARPAHALQLRRGRPLVRARRPALRGRRQVPRHVARDDVPVVHGHA